MTLILLKLLIFLMTNIWSILEKIPHALFSTLITTHWLLTLIFLLLRNQLLILLRNPCALSMSLLLLSKFSVFDSSVRL